MERKNTPMAEREDLCPICKKVTKKKNMGIIPQTINDCGEDTAPLFMEDDPFQFAVCFPCASNRGYFNPVKIIGDIYPN